MPPLDTFALIPLMPIAPHNTIADIGCGGNHTVNLGKFLYDGKLFALDVDQHRLEDIECEVREVGLTNVELLRSKKQKLPLEDDSIDGALVFKVLHNVYNPTSLLKDVRRCLRKSGWIVIVENYQNENGIDVDRMRGMLTKSDFRVKAQRELDGDQYMMLVRK